ncbi:uncharacterized protein UTRI_10039 [Ustilago trichophora]|uniref:Uncharacterized protein n=1 Tax=Ustilago trichophora TaxID=86804 RepID=A0A5C3DSC1_9BASI|nr:uncharacterized protein UTRI_10039 [Ustilago trichophora]
MDHVLDHEFDEMEQGLIGAEGAPDNNSSIVDQLVSWVDWARDAFCIRVIFNPLTLRIAYPPPSRLALDVIIHPVNLAYRFILYSFSLPIAGCNIVFAICRY